MIFCNGDVEAAHARIKAVKNWKKDDEDDDGDSVNSTDSEARIHDILRTKARIIKLKNQLKGTDAKMKEYSF